MAEAFGGSEAGENGAEDEAGISGGFGGRGGSLNDGRGLVHEVVADVRWEVGGDVCVRYGGFPCCMSSREKEHALGCRRS